MSVGPASNMEPDLLPRPRGRSSASDPAPPSDQRPRTVERQAPRGLDGQKRRARFEGECAPAFAVEPASRARERGDGQPERRRHPDPGSVVADEKSCIAILAEGQAIPARGDGGESGTARARRGGVLEARDRIGGSRAELDEPPDRDPERSVRGNRRRQARHGRRVTRRPRRRPAYAAASRRQGRCCPQCRWPERRRGSARLPDSPHRPRTPPT